MLKRVPFPLIDTKVEIGRQVENYLTVSHSRVTAGAS